MYDTKYLYAMNPKLSPTKIPISKQQMLKSVMAFLSLKTKGGHFYSFYLKVAVSCDSSIPPVPPIVMPTFTILEIMNLGLLIFSRILY
jgi:hypothetical protein